MRRAVQWIFLSLMMLTLPGQLVAAEDSVDHGSLCEFLAGHYIVIGKELDADRTYSGKVVFTCEKDHLAVTRDIQGEIVKGEGRIEHALGPDAADVLRVRFVRAGRAFEATYIWRSDLDNYARLSGYVYELRVQTDSPGLEALFIEQR